MHAMIPDTLQGALILSAIDFFLSFVIISGIGFVLALFPLLNRAARPRTRSRRAVVPKVAIDAETEDHVAVIAAAVYATMGGAHRIVNIEPSRLHGSWVAEGRAAHHFSHAPPPPKR